LLAQSYKLFVLQWWSGTNAGCIACASEYLCLSVGSLGIHQLYVPRDVITVLFVSSVRVKAAGPDCEYDDTKCLFQEVKSYLC